MARPADYDPSPLTAESYLTIPEVDALVEAGPRALRDPKALIHFLLRVALTLRGYHAQVQQLHRDVQQARMIRERAGQATTLSPLDAVRFLTPDQLAPIMDAAVREKLTALERSQTESTRAQRNAQRELNRVKFAVTGLLEDSDMNPRLREKLVSLLRSFDTAAEQTAEPTGPAAGPAAADTPAPAGTASLGDLFD